MGSQTLEILRQGVWASVTGGWFYDPHQNSFCNTVHLYIWLFLLCVPFTVYLYFPPSIGGWTIYCTLVAFLFGFVKIVNHSLHHMYDTTECIVIPADNLPPNEKRRPTKKNRDEEGIELQMLGVGRLSVGNKQSDNESVTSLEYHKPTNSTIDLKVDVHRKNSSESSVEDNAGTHRKSSESADTKHDHSATATEASNVQKLNSTLARARHTYRRDRDRRRGRLRQADLGTDRSKIEELSSEEGLRMERCSKQEDAVAVNLDNEMPNTEVSRKLHRSLLKKGSQNRDFFKEWLYLDCAEPSGEPYLSKFARQLSSDSRDNSELSISGGQSSPNKKLPSHQHRYLNIYSGDGCTKSSIALAHPQANNQTSNMRRNSNSTMSTIQLPLLNSTAQLVSHMRRHSNVTNASLGFLPTGSVELGAYMMEKSADGTQHGKGKSKAKTKSSGVRRIKSAALEIGCPPPSVSNLSPHPNSVETIGGQVLKNPKSAILPPPSKSLIRNPHLNLYPKNNTNSGEGCSYPYLNYGSEIVYPIAEISDEMQTSQCQESDLESISSQSYSDYDDENANMRHQFRGFDWHPNQSVEGNTSDSDYENNGSRSPLLDRKIVNEVRIVKSKAGDKQDLDVKKHQASDKILNKNNSFSADSKSSEKVKAVRLKKISKNNSFNVTLKEGTAAEDCDPRQRQSSETNVNIVSKSKEESENTEGNLSNAKGIPKMGVCDQSESHDKASASMLIEKPKVQTNECTFQQREKCATSDVTEKDNDRNELSNSSNSLEMHDATINLATETSDINEYKTETELQCKDLPVPPEMKEDIEVSSSKSSDENSLYNITWLFDESNTAPEKKVNETICLAQSTCCSPSYPKIMCIQPNLNVQKNLGAIPKQGKNLNRSRASSQKENKKKETKPKEKETEKTQEELMILDVVEAHTALVQGLESLFAAANTSTVALPMTKDERLVARQCPQTGDRTRKRSIEEVAQSSTNTLLPTSMPLLAAFLNSRTESTNLPIYIPVDAKITCCGFEPNVPNVESQRTKPLMDRNHRNRIRKIKRSTRQRNNPQFMADRLKVAKLQKTDGPSNSSQVHVAKSFNDTTDGAIHSFIDEYGNWMSYTFDKNSSGQAVQTQPAVINEKEEKHPKMNRVKPLGGASSAQGNNVSPGSCVSLTSEAVNSTDAANKCTRNDSLDQSYTNGSVYNSSSNQGSNNPLLSSNNNSTTGLPGNSNSKKFYVFDGGTTSQNEQPRSPVNYVTDSLLEQIEAERQARLGIPSVHMSAMMRERENTHINMPVSGSIGDNSLDLSISRTRFRLLDLIDNSTAIQPLTYHKFKIFKCWEVKVTMDRLKLMALFDRNLTLKETFISIILAIMVAVLGSMVLNIGFYKDIYAFWFCFIMAGSQYSLLKSVQPDAASPVHGFNKMVAFSRPVYFCLCTGILFGIHSQLETYPDMQESKRFKRSTESASDTFVLYGLTIKEKDLLMVLEDVLSKFLLFFPLAFSLGLFPQVNTFLMYLFEQIDMHIFGGNATSSLTASAYCVVRSLLAIGVLYGFAFSGLIEPKGSQHILFSIFCALLIPTSYHLSRSASDYTLVWNLLKTHLLPPDLYIVHNVECSSQDINKGNPETLSEKSEKKNNSESNISKQNSIGSSASKINFSSETNISKTQKRSHTSSVSSLKFENKVGDMINSSGSIKVEVPADGADREKSKQETEEKAEEEVDDPLPRKLQETVNSRLKNDVIVCSFMALFIFGIHCTTVFTTLQPELNPVVWWIAAILGWILHYLMPQLRKQQPWLCLSGPVLKAHEHTQYEVREQARLMWFEKAYVYLCFFERNLLYPVIFISAVTQDSPNIVLKFGPAVGALIVCVCALKCVRNAYSDPDSQYLILIFAVLLFQLDYSWASETFLVDYFLMAIVFNKMYEFLLKIQFIVTYIAPWQITWGSAFHAFAQPFSVPHSAMLFLQAGLSAILSTPLNPVLGSAIFMMSYVRPVKFWERDYNTKRVDQSNTRLSSQLERNLGADDNNLNSIFYEHLTRSLQHYLCGDLALGRWGQVQQGDCFVLASDYLNCLVHIVEMGNGLVSFQLRGLEFRGTYCQQREVEAISEGPEENVGCCCCAVGHLPRMLSVNAMFSLRWLAWQLTSVQYVLEGYSISDNSAGSLLQVFDFRKVLITYYVKSIIYYTIQSQKLEEWLTSPAICEALKATNDRNFVDLDPIFNVNLDEDYDFRTSGITRTSFCSIYHEWIVHCATLREDLYRRRGERLVSRDSPLVTLCFALSLVGRRSLGAASHNPVSNVEFFLYGLHALFKGDFRITSVRDEWVFSDMTLLHSVLAPAVRMALKLHQDHFMSPEEYSNVRILYTSISCYSTALVICHEAAPAWRSSVLRGAPHLLALRHVMDEGTDEYKIIMLNKRHLGFRVIRLNRECVRGLWAGQQHELVYLRNRNPERGSIQNAKQALRNIINSSCDQPIGYPIYVSPLTTSYAETSAQLSQLVGGALTLGAIRRRAVDLWRRIRRRCGEGCSSGSAAAPDAAGATVAAGAGRPPGALTPRHNTLQLSRTSLAGTRGSLASAGKPTSSTLASLAGLLGSSREHSLGPGALPEHPTQRGHPHEAGEAYTTIREGSSERKRRCDEAAGSDAVRVREGRHCGRTTSYSVKDGRQSIAKDRTKDSARRSKRDRERIRPASFRLLSAQERDGIAPGICPDNYEMHSLRDERDAPTRRERDNYEMQSSREDRDNRRDRNENYEMHSLRDEREGGSRRERDGRSQGSDGYDGRGSSAHGKENRAVQGGSREMRRNVTTKVRQPTPDSSLEDLTLNPSSLDVSGTDCKIIANRNTNVKYQPHHKRRSSDFSDASRDFPAKNQSERNIDNLTSTKDLSNAESCSEHCIPKPYNNELHVLAKMYRDMQNAGEISQIKTKVKRSDSLKTELKSHVSVGCKVIVVDPLGVYDCINLGRRIDVQWPSEYQRERGGRNHWGAWVPMQGMDGQVVHRWTPNHRDPKLRSHVDKTILLVQIDDRFVPIAENCVQDLGDEV